MTQAKVSVLLPVRNGEAFLRSALVSILQQTMSDFQLVVVNDQSTDRTMDILQRLMPLFRDATLLEGQGKGISQALNLGLTHCSANLVARMDADDIMLPRRLELQVEFLARHPNVAAVGGQIASFSGQGRFRFAQELPIQHNQICERLEISGYGLAHPTVMFRRALVSQVGGYNTKCDGQEDLDLWRRLSMVGELRNLPQPLILYRIHDLQQTRKLSDSLRVPLERGTDASMRDASVSESYSWKLLLRPSWIRLHTFEIMRNRETSRSRKVWLIALKVTLFPAWCRSLWRWRVAKCRAGGSLQ